MQTKVYAIIVTYNAMKWVDRCLTSLANSSINVNTVVIDNCSKDETVAYIKDHYPLVHLIENKANNGFGQANNQGIEYAYKCGGTHFFLLNQDAWVELKSIQRMVEIQDKYDLAVVSPLHLNGKGENLDFGFYRMAMVDAWKNHFLCDIALGQLKDYYIVGRVNAAAWMLKRSTIEKIGGFNPLFFHYGEDVNYLYRMMYHKESLAFIPMAFAYHDRDVVGNKKMFENRATISYLLNGYSNINVPMFRPQWDRTKMHLHNVKLSLACLGGVDSVLSYAS